jgi:peroxiredoxin
MLGGCAAQKKNDAESKVPHVGAVAPEFELPDAHGGKVSLAEARKKGPVLIVFYLGYSCPRCVAHLTELAARKQELDGYRTQVLLVGPDSVEDARGSIESFGDIPFAMLCDPEEGVAKAYGLVDKEILYHGLFVVDQGGKVQFAVKSAHPYEDFDTVFRVLEHLDKEKE